MKIFTTGQVAKICNVAPRTVSKWFDSGRLRGYRIPGSQDRRIPLEYLVKFLRDHGMPVQDLDVRANVIVISPDSTMPASLQKQFQKIEAFAIYDAKSEFDAGLFAATLHPHCMIVDFAIGHANALCLIANVRRHPTFNDVVIIAILPEDMTNPFREGINETFKRPFDIALFAERLRTHFGTIRELV